MSLASESASVDISYVIVHVVVNRDIMSVLLLKLTLGTKIFTKQIFWAA